MKNNIFGALILFAFLLISSGCKNVNKRKPMPDFDGKLSEFPEMVNTICFGSCNKQWEDQAYWKNISAQKPDLWIWMGDIIYSDTEDMVQMKQQYNFQKTHEEYISFSDSVKIIGVWDDHDYGLNDGGKEYPKKEECREILFDFLEIPQNSLERKHSGAYQSYTLGPNGKKVKIILLDGRYFRDNLDPDKNSEHRYLPNEEGSYLGEEQWKWLENELRKSEAQFNLIVSGIQVIPTEHYFEKWSNFPKERLRLFDLIVNSGAKNPFFISGDRHIAEMMKMNYKGLSFYEITSSGLTHSYEKADEENKFRISPLVGEKNFGKLELNWQEDSLKIKCLIHGIDAEVLFSEEIHFPL